MIDIAGPVAIGMVVGWMLYYFIRLYRLFSPKTLAATLTAIAGGPVLTYLQKLASGGVADQQIGLWYFLGVGLGFFLYAIYVGVLALMFAFGKIKTRPRFDVAAGCGAGISEELFDEIERSYRFEEVLKDWHEGITPDDDFKGMLPTLDFSQREYYQSKKAFDVQHVSRFDSSGYVKLLPLKSDSYSATDY